MCACVCARARVCVCSGALLPSPDGSAAGTTMRDSSAGAAVVAGNIQGRLQVVAPEMLRQRETERDRERDSSGSGADGHVTHSPLTVDESVEVMRGQ